MPAPTGARSPAVSGGTPTTLTWASGMRQWRRLFSNPPQPGKLTRRRTTRATLTSGTNQENVLVISFDGKTWFTIWRIWVILGFWWLLLSSFHIGSCTWSNSLSGRANKKVEEEEKLLKLFQGVNKSQQDTFMQWCEQTLHTLNTANNLDGKSLKICFVKSLHLHNYF